MTIQSSGDLKNGELIIYDPLGKIVKRISGINEKQITVDAKDLMNGLYFVRFEKGNVQVVGKFMKER